MTAHRICGSVVTIAVIMLPVLAAAARAADSTLPPERIAQFNLTPAVVQARSAVADSERGRVPAPAAVGRRSVGSAVSPNAGIGRGVSIDLSWDDAQYTVGQGRHIISWWNGVTDEGMEFYVHFGYGSLTDTTGGGKPMTGYNVYDAVPAGANWPRVREIGCDVQAVDEQGFGGIPSLDLLSDGTVVMGAMSHFQNGTVGGEPFVDNMLFYRYPLVGCWPGSSVPDRGTVDSSVYRPNFLDQSVGTYSRTPQVVTQWDGTSTVVHLLLGEDSPGTLLQGSDYCSGLPYYAFVYFRKVGETSSSGTWSAGKVIDSLWFPWASLAAAPYPNAKVAVTYTNPSYYGALLGNPDDLDVWLRESADRGLTWAAAQDITNYTNAVDGDPRHFTAWLESQALYTSDGVLHVIWTAKPTSPDPYFDGFFWQDYTQNIYHWDRAANEVSAVAFSPYSVEDDLVGSLYTNVCGFGGSNAGYIANVNLSECDAKLYCVWNQIHERANRFDWRYAEKQPAPGILDDCSYEGNRNAMANWEIMMSVAQISSPSLWDMPRNVSNTYTPNCGLAGDPEAQGLCGSEYKPSVEKYAINEAGLSLNWPPVTLLDLSPAQNYVGGWYLNMEYLDDQFPGPAYWGRTNPPATLNSIKWVRLACVEPVEAAQIAVTPTSLDWPEWVQLGTSKAYHVTVNNFGNVVLNVSEIGVDDHGGGWLGVSATSLTVPAGVDRTRTFNIVVDAGALSTTQWLDGQAWLKSDAANSDSVSILIHILAAADVEPMAWDTVATHRNMFDQFFEPQGACVALAVSSNGEMGHLGSGSVNLDYFESNLECGTREADRVYLKAGSPFVIMATSSTGAGAELTCSYMDPSQADPNGWDPTPAKGDIRGGLGYSGKYDSVYTGQFVNRDTTIAFERVVYGPRSANPTTDIINFVLVHTWVYSADGLAHNHVTFGNVCDWDVPSDSVSKNTTGVSSAGFVYLQGTDSVGHDGCQSNTNRFATEAFVGAYTQAEFNAFPCVNNQDGYFGLNAFSQAIMVDTTHYRNGTPLVPSQPNPALWWEVTSVPGLNADPESRNEAVFLTYKQNYNLLATDTLHFWTVMTTVRDGSLANLEAQVAYAKSWLMSNLRICCTSCCTGLVGDANGSGEDMPTIGDISVMIDAKFIAGACILSGPSCNIRCLGEADMNQSGGATPICDDITIGDISMLIDCLFITGPDTYVRNHCGC